MAVLGHDMPTSIGAVPREGFAEYSFVALARAVEHNGTTLPAGTEGVVVHRHSDGLGYEVEFEHPTFAVITLSGADLTSHE